MDPSHAKASSRLSLRVGERNWNVTFSIANGSQLRETYPARGRLIAGEIEFESQFSTWMRYSRFVWKWCVDVFYFGNRRPLEIKSLLFYFFLQRVWNLSKVFNHTWVPQTGTLIVYTLAQNQFLERIFSIVRMQRSLNDYLTNKLLFSSIVSWIHFLLLSSHRNIFSTLPSSSTKQVNGHPNVFRQLRMMSSLKSTRHIRQIKDWEMNGWAWMEKL